MSMIRLKRKRRCNMCCLFGVLDFQQTLTRRQRQRLSTALSIAAQTRGTDATGLAYISGNRLQICKAPRPARAVHFRIPDDARAIMGHTRMTTQGSASHNCNNHPFSGKAGHTRFALAHNGVLYNDRYLRHSLGLPATRIETDSYVAVQLIERRSTLDCSTLRYMAEQIEGSFVFTILDQENRLYVVKGDNPFCLWHFPRSHCYVYASTEAILKEGLRRSRLRLGPHEHIPVRCGEILCLEAGRPITRDRFDDSRLPGVYSFTLWQGVNGCRCAPASRAEDPYLEALRAVAPAFGYTGADLDRLVGQGFSPTEIEELFYCGQRPDRKGRTSHENSGYRALKTACSPGD